MNQIDQDDANALLELSGLLAAAIGIVALIGAVVGVIA